MLEIPESRTIASQWNRTVTGRTIRNVSANASPHGFAFYFGDPAEYPRRLNGRRIGEARALAGQIEIDAEAMRLLFGDGVNIRYYPPEEEMPGKHQLLLGLDDGASIVCTVQMYGGLWAYPEGENENPYYLIAKEKPSPLSADFDEGYFASLLEAAKPSLSAKAFLATEQRIPGLGNGVLQDILFLAGIHPRTRLAALKEQELEALYRSVKNTLREMTDQGGRNTEKDLLGRRGGYEVHLSSLTWKEPCPVCGSEITRQAYLGGNVYFCPSCQPLRR
ncbi:hypothetical protein [Paenibacillus macerans]|uniref:hypothetical protein n=1 Tax=Paenibacillus macerans TaxID=44252 RepID=UPI003D311240